MPKASPRKHGPAHVHLLLFFDRYYFLGRYSFLGFPCFCKPIKMAGVGYGVTPMSRLSQHSSRRRPRPHTGKPLDLSSPNTLSKKKAPKRKTLSSRYTAVLPSKRRKLGVGTIRDPVSLLGESHQAPEAHHVAVSPKACNASEVSFKEKETRRPSTRGRACKTKARGRGVNARVKASRGLKAELCPVAKLLDSKEIFNEEAQSVESLKPDSFHFNDSTEVGFLPDGNLNGASISSSPEHANSKVGLRSLETSGAAGAAPVARKNDLDSMHAEPRQSTEKHVLVSKKGPGRKSSKRLSSLESPGAGLRPLKAPEAVCLNNEINPSTLTGSQVQDVPNQDVVDRSSLIQDPLQLEGSLLRPRRKARKRSKLEEHRLPPWDYVGKRVVVYWPHAKAWYAGKVIMYDDTSKKHKIKYDDNDEECISFRRHKVILEKPLSTQSAVNKKPDKGVFSPQRVQFLEEEVALWKTVQGENVKDRCVLEDNALLSAFAPRHRGKEGSHETLCNGSVMPTGAVKGLDATPSNNTPRHKISKKSIPLAAHDHTGGPATGVKGASGGKEAFVYVRRTKGRRKVDVSSTDKAIDGRIREAAIAVQQETTRKRKSCQSFVQQTAQPDFSDCKFHGNESSFSDAPAACGSNENGSTTLERASRKRNKRSLKKLVSQASSVLNAELAQESEPRQDQLRKQRARITRRKLARKQKLNNAVFTARNRRLPTKRVLCLADNVEGLASSSTLCHDAAKLYNLEVPAGHMFMHESVSLFACTIHLVLPVVIPDLFTWQLFSILTCRHFCGGGSFDETFSFNGSMRDWLGMFRILVRIIKAMPLSAYMYGRQWQSMILHELWSSLPWCEPAQTDALASLPPEIETLLLEHLLDASVSCRMTSREILNLFVCYFIRPYIFATICEKGISIQVAVQQFLVRPRSQDGGTCLRQSVKHFPLQSSSGSADKGFASYMRLFPRSTDWCTEEGVFLKQMQVWISTTERAGCAESWSPILAVKKLDLGWQVISICLVSGGNAMDKLEQKNSSNYEVFKLEQESTKSGYLNEFHFNCLSHVEVRNSPFALEHGLPSGPYNSRCLNSALLFTASLQKLLSKAVGKDLGSAAVSFRPLAVSVPPLGKASGKDEQFKQTQLIGQLRSASEDASEVKISAALPNLGTENDTAYSCFWKSSRVVNAPRKHVKVEPDSNFSRRDSSITTEFNNAGIKEESSVEMYERQQPLSSFLLKPDLVGHAHAGVHVKTDEQHFSGHMDQEYYDNKFSKGVKMVKKSRPRYRSERKRPLFKERPTYYCIADLVFLDNECAQRELGARVELQSKADSSFLIFVHAAGKSFEQRIVEGGMLAKNPFELTWKSENGWVLDFTDREQWELFRCMYNELCSQALRATCVKEIPIPVVLEMEAYNGDSQARSSLRPFFAIKSPGDEIEAAFRTGRVLYDLDSEDEAWMAETNRVGGNKSISDGTLERIIDRLEKEAHRRGEAAVAVHDAIEFCQDLAGADTVQAVHSYWSTKRLAKGMSLLRYFQPPLWEQYQDELRAWENRMQQFSPDSQSRLQDRYPRPIMSAFCLQSRTFDSLDNGKRMLRQRSQRKIRPTSRSSSEDSHRLPVYHNDDSTRVLTHHSEHTYSTIRRYQHLDHDQEDEGFPECAKAARAKAFEARRVAETRALKLQRRFLEFDSSLQKAWASLIEYTVSGGDTSAQSEALEGRMTRLFNRCSSLFSKGDDSSEDEPPSHSGHVCGDVGDEFLEAFAKKCSLDARVLLCKSQDKALGIEFEEASPLLPIFVKGSSYAWNGSSLL